MRVGIISAYMDYHRQGKKNHGVLQPGIGPLIGGLLPPNVDVEVINETKVFEGRGRISSAARQLVNQS
jgi:hypothetical protein